MLGSLAKWLRIFGNDTFYPTAETTDDDLLRIATEEQRVLITRDKELIVRAKKHHLPVLMIATTNLDEQITQVLHHIGFTMEKLLTRCIVCNTPLRTVEKRMVKSFVPPKVFETRDEFWFCPVCSKYYWKGTHYENMSEKIKGFQKTNSRP